MKTKKKLLNVTLLLLLVAVCGLGFTPDAKAADTITNIVLSPASPATLAVSEDVKVTFDYTTDEAGGVRIFARPFSNGGLSPNFSAHGSIVHAFPGGSGDGDFRINTDNVRVDQIRFQMLDEDQNNLLLEFFISVEYHVCDGICVWYVDTDAAGTESGFNWANAFNDLQDPLAFAFGGEQIWVAEGTYYPDQGPGIKPGNRDVAFQLVNEVGVYGGFDATEADLNDRDWKTNETILSGDIGIADDNSDNSYHVVTSFFDDPNTVLDGFTVTQGNANGDFPKNIGGGMYITSNSSTTVNNCIFINNTADGGAGVAAWTSESPSFLNCCFINNTATGSGGGMDVQKTNPTIRSCWFLGNSAQNGGGIRFLDTNKGAPSLVDCAFSGNTATLNGGGLYNAGVGGNANPFPPDLLNCSFSLNTATVAGGGIYNNVVNNQNDDVTLDSCILWGNSDAGGTDESAQFVSSSGTPTINYSDLEGWTGALGGVGNIGLDPLFVDPDGLDDVVGTVDDNLRLDVGSPCIDTGNPSAALIDSDGTRNDMGAPGEPCSELGAVPGFDGSGFIFTTVGLTPTSEITQDNFDPLLLQGTANVDPGTAAALSIPAYMNTAFGSTLRLHGLFGNDDTDGNGADVDYYQVLAGPWDANTPPGPGDFQPLDDKLAKVLYTYDVGLGEWTSQLVTLGPQTIDSIDDVYQLTTTGFWSLIDLRLVWNTTQVANGKLTLRIKAYHQNPDLSLTDVTGALGPVEDLILYVDNSPVSAIIHSVKYDPSNPNYDPNSDGEIPECGILNLLTDTENVRFTITASHPNGFLRLYRLDALFGKNKSSGIIASDSYSKPPALWSGVTNTEFASEDSTSLDPWQQCAYQFRLRAWARVTNGYNHIFHKTFNDHLTLDLGPGTCGKADINNSGEVDILDFVELSKFFLQICEE